MFNLLRMDMYQIFKGSLFRIFALLIVLYTFGFIFMTWFVETPQYQEWMSQITAQNAAEMEYASDEGLTIEVYEVEEAADEQESSEPSQLDILANLLIGNGLLSLLITIYIAVIITNEFNSGYIKNILTARVSRARYFLSKAISIVVVSTVLTLVGILSIALSCALFGLPLVASPLGEIVLWTVCVIGLLSAMSMLVALIAWLTRSKVGSVLSAVVIVSGLLVGILKSALAFVPAVASLFDFSLSSTLNSLWRGLDPEIAFSLPHIVGVAVGFFILYALLSYLCIKKRDV